MEYNEEGITLFTLCILGDSSIEPEGIKLFKAQPN